MSFKKGFTLIELLVVVAIIGILASVVLASLNSARAKGADAAIKANLDNMRAQAALYYDSNSNKYSVAAVACNVTSGGTATGCTDMFQTSANLGSLQAMTAAAAASGSTAYGNTTAAGDAWAAWVALKSTTTSAWCVDSLGTSKVETTLPATTATVCP